MFLVELTATTVANVRMAPSPALEVVEWLFHAARGRQHPRFGDTGPAARLALRHPDVALVVDVLPAANCHYMPDLLTPKPGFGDAQQTWKEQLETIAATPQEVVHRQVAVERFPRGDMPASVRSAIAAGSFARRAANGLRLFWRDALVDQWPTLHAVLDADIARRATVMARNGVAAVLNSLHPRISWRDGQLRIDKPFDGMAQVAGPELVLTPSVLGGRLVALQVTDPHDAMLMYPASGTNSTRPSQQAMPRLVGRSRAALLDDLNVPRSTGELSRRLGLAPATVSYHLGVLLRANVVTRFRSGALVLYCRNSAGDSLLRSDLGDVLSDTDLNSVANWPVNPDTSRFSA